MWYSLFRWCLWSVAFSLVPFFLILTFRWIDLAAWPGFNPAFGSGQLLLTCVALLAGGLKELSSMKQEVKHRRKETVSGFAFIFGIFTAAVYGYIANRYISGNPFTEAQQNLVTNASIVCLLLSFLITASAIILSAPAGDSLRRPHANEPVYDSLPGSQR